MISPQNALPGGIAELLPGQAHGGGPDAAVRWLARTQKLDGSWGENVEWTAAALLAFIRSGHTTRTGSYRRQLRRATSWLADHPGGGFARFARVLALEELAAATGDAKELVQAGEARQNLPQPVSPAEQAVAGSLAVRPDAIRNLDNLRLAAALKAALPVPASLFEGNEGDLARTWAAALPDR